jgi:hypothetical protein
MQINYRNVQLIILLISNVLLEIVLCIALITLRFDIVSSFSIKIK